MKLVELTWRNLFLVHYYIVNIIDLRLLNSAYVDCSCRYFVHYNSGCLGTEYYLNKNILPEFYFGFCNKGTSINHVDQRFPKG